MNYLEAAMTTSQRIGQISNAHKSISFIDNWDRNDFRLAPEEPANLLTPRPSLILIPDISEHMEAWINYAILVASRDSISTECSSDCESTDDASFDSAILLPPNFRRATL